MDKFKFERQPPIILKSGQYTTANLRKSRGFAVFRYRPRDNTTTIFNILACGVCSVKAKFRGPGYFLDEQIGGVFDLRAPALPPGKRFSIQITASQSDLVKMSRVKILATEGESSQFTDNSAMRDKPWEYRTLHKCRASWCSSSRASRTSSMGGSSTAGPYSKEGSSSSGSSGTNSSPTAPSRRNPAHSLTRPCPSP